MTSWDDPDHDIIGDIKRFMREAYKKGSGSHYSVVLGSLPMRTEWNWEPALAQRVLVTVADAPQFPRYWAKPFVGEHRFAVEIYQNGKTFYIDNEDGSGWFKVTNGGSPDISHRVLAIKNVLDRMPNEW
jgi:hypothetical protein